MIERLERFEPSLLVESRDKPALVDASHERGIDQQIRVGLFRLRILVGKNFQAALYYFERRIGLLFQNTEGIYIFKTNKPKSLAVMKKHLLGASDEVLEETYRYTSSVLEQQPYPSLDVVKSGLEILSYNIRKRNRPTLICWSIPRS